jgi:L-alanine-DL-glutamate epimerase-like enolase superfamily enzyme
LLITDEGSASIEEMENCLISDAGGGALLKMVRSGGFSYVIKLARLLKDFPDFKLAPCSMTETGIGTMANLHSAVIIHEHCHPLLGFGFDGPMQVMGESYRQGNDTILYPKDLIIRDAGGTAVYNPGQVVGDGRGLGLKINSRYLEKITIGAATVTLHDGDVVMEACVSGKRKTETIGRREELLKHPRY